MYNRDLLWSTLSGFSHAILVPYDLDVVLSDLTESAHGEQRNGKSR